MIVIESKRRKRENILKKYPDAVIADVTSQATDDLVKLSPFYPHGGIPVPFSEGYTAMCVEAIWQGLKVFESADVDVNMFGNDTMKNIKRTVRRFGKPLGRCGKAAVCDDHGRRAVIDGLSGNDLLHRPDADRLGVVFALDGVFLQPFPRDDVHAVVAAGLGHFYIIEAVLPQIRRHDIFVFISVHKNLVLLKMERSLNLRTPCKGSGIFRLACWDKK